MSAVTIVELPDEKRFLYALTVDQYHQMIADGIRPIRQTGAVFRGPYHSVPDNSRG